MLEIKKAFVIPKGTIRASVEGVTFKKLNSYFQRLTVRGYSLKQPLVEAYPFFMLKGEVFIIITEDSYLYQVIKAKIPSAEEKKIMKDSMEKEHFGLDDIWNE